MFHKAYSFHKRSIEPAILNIFIKSDNLPKIKDSKTYMKIISKFKIKYILFICLVIAVSGCGLYLFKDNNKTCQLMALDFKNIPNYHLYSPQECVQRAIQAANTPQKDYHLLFNNCEHFAFWCRCNVRYSKQVPLKISPYQLESLFYTLKTFK